VLHAQKLFPTEACVHDPPMRLFWKKASDEQLELLGVEPVPPVPPRTEPRARNNQDCGGNASVATAQPAAVLANGHPLLVPLDRLYEDPNNPRTEFPKSQIDEIADDIRERGILEPIVVHPADAAGRYRIHFGAKPHRAARRVGFAEVAPHGPEPALPGPSGCLNVPAYLGSTTLSMTWITPLSATMSVAVTLAPSTITPPAVATVSSEPCTVLTLPAFTSLAITLPATTW
jgi:hypothetical protein